jgi:hypothetical protein
MISPKSLEEGDSELNERSRYTTLSRQRQWQQQQQRNNRRDEIVALATIPTSSEHMGARMLSIRRRDSSSYRTTMLDERTAGDTLNIVQLWSNVGDKIEVGDRVAVDS